MKHVLYALLTAVSILFTSCGPSSNTNNPQVPNVPQPQPQPQPGSHPESSYRLPLRLTTGSLKIYFLR